MRQLYAHSGIAGIRSLSIDFGFAFSVPLPLPEPAPGFVCAAPVERTPETFHDCVQCGLPLSWRVYSATSTSWRTPLSSTRPETPYLPSRPPTVVACFFVVFALILPVLAGTPDICGIVSMFTLSVLLNTSMRTLPRVYVTGTGLQFVDISSN